MKYIAPKKYSQFVLRKSISAQKKANLQRRHAGPGCPSVGSRARVLRCVSRSPACAGATTFALVSDKTPQISRAHFWTGGRDAGFGAEGRQHSRPLERSKVAQSNGFSRFAAAFLRVYAQARRAQQKMRMHFHHLPPPPWRASLHMCLKHDYAEICTLILCTVLAVLDFNGHAHRLTPGSGQQLSCSPLTQCH